MFYALNTTISLATWRNNDSVQIAISLNVNLHGPQGNMLFLVKSLSKRFHSFSHHS